MKRIRINCMYISCIKTLIGQVVADYSECVLFPGPHFCMIRLLGGNLKNNNNNICLAIFPYNFLICCLGIIPLCIYYLIFRFMFYIMPFCFHNKF